MSHRVVATIAVIAFALLIFSLVEHFFPGWVIAIILGAYVIVAVIKRNDAVRRHLKQR